MPKVDKGLENKNIWHMILSSTHFREVKANPLKMKGCLVKIRALASPFYNPFLMALF